MLEEKDGNLQDPVGKEGLNSENETTQEEQTSQEDPLITQIKLINPQSENIIFDFADEVAKT